MFNYRILNRSHVYFFGLVLSLQLLAGSALAVQDASDQDGPLVIWPKAKTFTTHEIRKRYGGIRGKLGMTYKLKDAPVKSADSYSLEDIRDHKERANIVTTKVQRLHTGILGKLGVKK